MGCELEKSVSIGFNDANQDAEGLGEVPSKVGVYIQDSVFAHFSRI